MAGQALTRLLAGAGDEVVALTSRSDCDLESMTETTGLFASCRPTQVYHLAGAVYGLGGNLAFPGDIFRRNTLINTHVIEACRLAGVAKIVAMGTVAMYPDGAPMPMREEDVLEGAVHASEGSYAAAKRGMLYQLESYGRQFGLDYALALSTNLYGPGDRFDEAHGHVIPSLVRKFSLGAARGEEVAVWGDGSPTRDFLYADDAAMGLRVLMAQGSGRYNLASGSSVRIRNVVEILAALFPGARYRWDTGKPMGQTTRSYDIERLAALGFRASTDLRTGLERTVAWYKANEGSLRLS